jgi:hypothetical protein
MPWTLDILSLTGATQNSDVNFRSARITWAQDGTGACEVALREPDVSGGLFRAGQKRLAFRDAAGTRRFQGFLEQLERAGSPSDIRYRASGLGLASILSEGCVHGNFSQTNVVATTIAWALITHFQAQADAAYGFTQGSTTGTAPSRTRHFCDGDVIAEGIRELAERDTGGFAWEIDANGAFNTWVGGRGTDVSGSVTIAPSDTIDWSCVEDMTEYRTYVTCLGDSDQNDPCGAPLAIASGGTPGTYMRREEVVEDASRDVAELTETATEELDSRVASRIRLRTSWVEGQGPWSFGTRWIGDTVTAALGAAFGGNATVKCIGITITLESTHEFVEYEWAKA